ncbi:MAG: tetratricopeptide repeat protein [Ardenticatenaceae bacterium]|nr:tetratricopeptide repeat protein [Ardenticatenaceae bacterium]
MAEQLTITLLGSLTVTRGDVPVTGLGTRKAEALLAYLVVNQRPFSRELLADLLWDDRPQDQALANLRSILSGLRRELGDHLIITRQTVGFNSGSDYWLDVAAFEQLLKLEDSRLGDADYQTSINNLQTAVAYYQDDFLAGFHVREAYRFEEWAVLERERLRRLAVRALRQLVDDSLSNGRYAQGIQYADQLIRLDNLSEHAHRQKMMLLARSGQRNAALQQYDACRRLLDEELGVEPAAATTALFERLRALSFPPPHNLPPPPTPFIGRATELLSVRRHLVNPAERLVTLFGPGGMGKTRLALESARQIVEEQPGQFFDGVFYVPLAAVATAQQLPDQIAHAVGFTFQGSEPREVQLVNYLRDKEMLLVLDNFEQFLGADETGAALVAEILRETAHITLLITSRERLNLYEEAVFETAGLDVPPNNTEMPEQYSAVQLFLQRVRRLRHDYVPAPADLAVIVRACRLLDGMPLAIELAAGWTRQHSFSEIEMQIAASFDFLQTTFRNVPPRQRSLRAVFDHSWQLLSPQEQRVFTQLAIFPNSFTLAAAQAVVADLAEGAPFMALVDKSLVERELNGRFQVHPILHQYALEKLADDKVLATAVARRHTGYYLAFIEQQESGQSLTERAAIAKELPNVQAVWERTAQQQNYTALDRIIPTLHDFYSAQSWFQEGIDAFNFALAHKCEPTDAAQCDSQAQTMCDLLARKARMHIHIGQLQEADAALAEAMMYLKRVDEPDRRSMVLSYMSMTQFYAGHYDPAIELLEESLHLALQADNLGGISFAYNFLGSCYKAKGEYQQAHIHFEHALDAYRQADDEIGEGVLLHNLGNLAQAMRDYAAAQEYYRACTDVFKAIDYTQGIASTLSNAGRLALQMENYPEAKMMLAEALTLKEQLNDERGMAVALTGLGAVAVETRELAQARAHLVQALPLAQKSGDVKSILEALVVTAVYAHRLNQDQTAAQLVAFTLDYPNTVQEVRQQAEKLAEMLPVTAVAPPLDLDDFVTKLLSGFLAAS